MGRALRGPDGLTRATRRRGVPAANRAGRQRVNRFADALVAGFDVAEQGHAFQKEMIGRVRLHRHADLEGCGAVGFAHDKYRPAGWRSGRGGHVGVSRVKFR
jgi:hypothetical protein